MIVLVRTSYRDTTHTLHMTNGEKDVDWEYPGGNGQDYKQNPNSGKTDEITSYALLLKEIKAAIGSKELSIAVPGLKRDMIAFTAQQVPLINDAVDVVNGKEKGSRRNMRKTADISLLVMAYDLMNR